MDTRSTDYSTCYKCLAGPADVYAASHLYQALQITIALSRKGVCLKGSLNAAGGKRNKPWHLLGRYKAEEVAI